MLPAGPLETLGRLAAALAAGGAFAFAAYRAGFLTRTAATLAGMLAASILALGGPAWAAPALLFFGPSVALSRLADPAAAATRCAARPQPARRGAWQVLANGGVAWGLLLAAPWAGAALCFWGFAGAFAAAAADTWATEVGRRFGGPPRSLRTLGRVAAGASGAVSLEGTAAALGGAVVVSAGAWPFASAFLPPGTSAWAAALVVAGAGILGATADSLAGAFLQARYRDAQTGRVTEAPFAETGQRNERMRGLPLLTNSGVNVLCTAVGAASAAAGVAAL